nr:CmpA/NrtA family ABC transporter substrate-binding protein [uncultured Limnobacter sp.]
MHQDIRIGVIALTDSAPFVVAQQLGFFEAENLSVELLKQASWATLRDKLAYGEIDAAHMLSPMAIAMQLGLGGSPRKDVVAPLVLNRSGNAITVSKHLAAIISGLVEGETLGSALRAGKSRGERGMVFGTVFPFSMHTLQLRRWLRLNDVDPDQDVRFEVVPPIRMVASLQAGLIDAFCVGEPYNSLAVNEGLGTIVATSNSLWPKAPEKVLGCTRAWAQQNPVALRGLSSALRRACNWLEGGVANRSQAAAWLSTSDHVNLPSSVLEMALLATIKGGTDPFIQFDGAELTKDQRPMFESLVVETHALTSALPLDAGQFASGLTPFGF